jgi:flagellin
LATDKIVGNVSGRALTQSRSTAAINEVFQHTDNNYYVRKGAAGDALDTEGGDADVLVTTQIGTATDIEALTDLAYRIQKLKTNFGEDATDRAFMYQSHHNVAITDIESAISALDFVDAAAKVVNESRARMGATMSRIEYTINNLMNLVENTEEAKSRVLDTDYAKESAELAKAQILAQAGTAMLAQANQSQQYVLNLLRQG